MPNPASQRRVWFETFGCQMNKLDAELIRGDLLEHGYLPAERAEAADVILFTTCSVRQHAEDRVYSRLGALQRAKARRPGLIIGVLSCMAQKDRDEIVRRAPHVDLVCGTHDMFRLRELIEQVLASRRRIVATEVDHISPLLRYPARRPVRHRAYVAIMRGCDNYCSYCVVPYVRGREVSRPPAEIVDECRRLADDGCKEITLLGQNVNSYGTGLEPRVTFPDLLGLLNEVPGLERMRFVTSHPKDASRELFAAMACLDKVCEQIHLPPQSGSDRILELMHRGYTAAQYRELAAMARALVAGVEFAADFIVGFPTETEDDFEASGQLMRDVEFPNSFVFKYSPRPGTAAARLPDDVPAEVKARRNGALLALQQQISARKHAAMVGQTVEVLVDGPSKKDPARLSGRTRRNHIVVFQGDAGKLAGQLVSVRIESSTALTLFGRLA
jgi:tRNA-2-methylthio-N6-dimethylallyladenosine synthase